MRANSRLSGAEACEKMFNLALAKPQRSQRMDENGIGRDVMDAAMAVDRELDPGLLETVYEVVLLDELRR